MSLGVVALFGIGAWRSFPAVSRRRFGVPEGGPWDRESARLALALGGGASVFELLHGTAEFKASQVGSVAVVGAEGGFELEGKEHPLCVRAPVQSGDRLKVRARVAYVAFSPIQMGQAKLDWRPRMPSALRYLPSIEPAEKINLTVSPNSSRAGVRLIGLGPSGVPERPSEPTCVGAIQYTPGGELILIGPDGPTVGGYPRLGSIVAADLDLVARLAPNQGVSLVPVDWEGAYHAEREWEQFLQERIRKLRAIQQG